MGLSTKQRVARRKELKRILLQHMIDNDKPVTLAQVARDAGVSREAIAAAIRTGDFTPSLALKVEKAYGGAIKKETLCTQYD